MITNDSSPVGGFTKSQLGIIGGVCFVLFMFMAFAGSSSNDETATTKIIYVERSGNDNDHGTTENNNNENNSPPALSISSTKQMMKYVPQIRYEPSPFFQGQTFGKGETPLTKIRAGTALIPNLPRDWDGGYGWIFVKYIPSPFEASWKEKSKLVEKQEGHPLCLLKDQEFNRQHDIYLNDLPRFASNTGDTKKCENGKIPSEPPKFNDEVYSKFEYVYKCTRPPCHSPPPADGPKVGDVKYSYIEPLVGLLRHPMACSNQFDWILNKNYMIIDAWGMVNPSRSTISPKPNVLFFDGGASTFREGAGGASQHWFYSVYKGECLNITDWFMFEVSPLEPQKVFQQMPGHIKPGYRWYNIPLTTAANHWDNPINHLLVQARKEDVVIFKIDFDSPTVELGLIQQILEYPQVSELIDELFFEHHVNMEIMKNYWATGKAKEYHSDSLKLFTSLREKGIRAHSWV